MISSSLGPFGYVYSYIEAKTFSLIFDSRKRERERERERGDDEISPRVEYRKVLGRNNNNNNNVGCSLADYKRSLYYPPIFIISFITRSGVGFYLPRYSSETYLLWKGEKRRKKMRCSFKRCCSV